MDSPIREDADKQEEAVKAAFAMATNIQQRSVHIRSKAK
jgi:hypothetical protein